MDANQLVQEVEQAAQNPRWRKWLLGILAVLLAMLGSFMVGRYTKAPEVKTITKTDTKVVTQVQYQDRIVEKKVYVQVEKKREHVETTTTKQPDGTTVTKTTDDTSTDDTQTDNVDKNAEHQQQTAQTVTQTVTVEKLVTKMPDWRVAGGVGISIPYYLGSPAVGVQALKGFVIQAEIDRRVVGPFYLGLFGNTQGTVGLNLSGGF